MDRFQLEEKLYVVGMVLLMVVALPVVIVGSLILSVRESPRKHFDPTRD